MFVLDETNLGRFMLPSDFFSTLWFIFEPFSPFVLLIICDVLNLSYLNTSFILSLDFYLLLLLRSPRSFDFFLFM